MSYRLVYTSQAVKDLKKLPKDIARNIVSALERIQIRPYDFVLKLVGEEIYRLKVGRYRVILDIKDNDLVILVIHAGHRKNICKK